MKFGDNFLKYRKLRGFTQDAIAEKLQVSRQSVSKWENGEAIPDLGKIIKISELLEVSLDELCGQDSGKERISEQCLEVKQAEDGKARGFSKIRVGIIAACVVLLIVVSFFAGYQSGHYAESNSYQALGEISVTGIDFQLERERMELTCEFVPSVYSEKFLYTVYAYSSLGHETKSIVKFENGIGKATVLVGKENFYKVVLVVESGEKSRNITLADKVEIWEDFAGVTVYE